MGALGNGSPFPFELGGGPSRSEQSYQSLKHMVGIGGSAADGTAEAEWRLARARGLAAAVSSEERAIMQSFPHLATDFIEVYESIFGITPDPESDDETRRQAIADYFYNLSDASGPSVELDLQKIDPRFSIDEIDWGKCSTTLPGRGFEDFSPGGGDACGPSFGVGRSYSLFPNYSSAYVDHILFDGTAGTETNRRILNRAYALLNTVLPAWCGYQVGTASSKTAGFILDISHLDIDSFYP